MNSKAVLVCDAVGKVYTEAGSALEVLKDVCLTITEGERISIMGTSGSGKSTLLNILGGLEAPTQGEVCVGGESLYSVSEEKRAQIRNRQLGFVYQFHHLLPEFDAVENVAMPLLLGKVAINEARTRAQEMLKAVGLSARLTHKPAQLSGGERQRVAIARALVTQPACVLMDEPTGNLDNHTANDVQDLMARLNQEFRTSFIIVTHDAELAHRMDRVLELREGGLHPLTKDTA
ncbi:lipoprotein-releasing ABC transporter ATP-binding protein LolD [Neptunomonas qingdaonensis]|uniref:Lipoprotein-releasing system ATP-binding protein LolD n=1 Tax=Neptunomonas qingdaonensis TaxID=1045558 RepID=A0A1I2RMI5_9GAMM|nr:lipoprotein-releasing ABC transporter ATP-binding protein LolD [Neptunomonas qingdaonensis]SFG41758.1 lipoprotein-releasing system ATP-binding protein [Neptunomonas qingdaonensis]